MVGDFLSLLPPQRKSGNVGPEDLLSPGSQMPPVAAEGTLG